MSLCSVSFPRSSRVSLQSAYLMLRYVMLWHILVKFTYFSCADPESLANVLLFIFKGEEPNDSKSVPLLASHRNAIEVVFRWRANNSRTLNADFISLLFSKGSGPVSRRNLIDLYFFHGCGEIRIPLFHP